MRLGAHGWCLVCVYSGAAMRWLSTHTSHQVAALSYLLRDPREFPVVIVAGRSFSACTTLYRTLPTATYTAYNSETALDRGTTERSATYPDLPHSSSVRLVPHTSAFLGPELCEERDAYVDIMQGAAEPVGAVDTDPSLDADDGDAAALDKSGRIARDTRDEEEMRRSIASSFTEHFLSSIDDTWHPQSTYRSGGETAPMQASGELHARLVPHGGFHGIDSDFLVSRHDVKRGALVPRVHWVVARWLTDYKVDVRKAIDAWSSVLSHSRPGEVVSLVLFVNVEVVDIDALIGIGGGHRLQTGLNLKCCATVNTRLRLASPPPCGCAACAAVWWPLSARSSLWVSLHPLHAQATILAEASFACASSAEATGATALARREGMQIGAAAGLPRRRRHVEVAIVNCWDTANREAEGGHATHFIALTASAFRHLFSVVPTDLQTHDHRPRPGHGHLQRIPDPLPKWQWVLHKDSSPCAVPPSGAMLSRALPYLVVSDAEEQQREHQRAMRRNAVDAATLQSLNSGVLSAGLSTAVCDPTSAPLPSPRYFTTLVSDVGSLLACDGCLSDLFVLEFQPALLEAEESLHYQRLMRTKIPRSDTGSTLRRYHARLELLSAAEKYVASALPSTSLTRDFLNRAMGFLYNCGRGRGVLAWPLIDPAEGRRCLRVGFTLSYEFHTNPLFFFQHLRGAARAGRAGEARMYRPASGDDLVSSPSAAGPGESQPPLAIETVKEVICYILMNMRRLGWVLVWQEDHHRWPTAVPPPHMHPNTNTLPFDVSLRRYPDLGLQARIAASLEKWRQEQLRHSSKRYDVDVSAKALKAPASHQMVEPARMAAEGAVTASPYTSLDVWQAALIPEDAGVYLWEGQTVFLDDGRPGVIVEFRPPPEELFTPVEHHPTEAKRTYWREQQQLHADFIRFYRWRCHCCAAAHPRHITAAFTGLPHYIRAREMARFPVVKLLHASATGKRLLVQVLPRRTMWYHIAYPRVRVVSAAEQKRWHEAHGQTVFAESELQDEVRLLSATGVDGRSASSVMLLRLPLSPFRIEVAASLFVSRVMELSKLPGGYEAQHALWHATSTNTRRAVLQRLHTKWAIHHGNTIEKYGSAAQRLRAAQRLGHIRWRSFAAQHHSTAALCFAGSTARHDAALL
ncbi:hypothetical protein Q4I30_006577 [Leishmania utingensis]|uniref:Uncharacterized protein n=1 Tax=Leishmania utingensis TaxID=653362 RepID=A0AAW3A249_9TRYP